MNDRRGACRGHGGLHLVALAAIAACSLDRSAKTACKTGDDCVAGYACVANRCVSRDGGAGPDESSDAHPTDVMDGGATDTPDGRNDAAADAIRERPVMCPASTVTSCPPDEAGATSCEETFCGGRLWREGFMFQESIPYRILDPQQRFSASYRDAIRAVAAAWARATSGFLAFEECGSCAGRFISVVPGEGDGIMNPDELEELLPMPVGAGGRVSPHRIAHQWGHVVGLAHTYQRADRDRYMRFDPAVWCGPDGRGLPPRCALAPSGQLGAPPIASDTFGVFDGRSKMNGFRADGICGAEEPDPDSGEPTLGDISAAAELLYSHSAGWSPFQPIGRSVSPTEPLDYQLAPGVDPVGSPAIAEWTIPSPEIFVRGTDDRIYATQRDPSGSAPSGWSAWTPVASDGDSDPAAVFGAADTLYVAVRSRADGTIQLGARVHGTWMPFGSLGMPAVGAASGPALATLDGGSLSVFVRGGDGLVYGLECSDARTLCGGGGVTQPSAWIPLQPPPAGRFVGKPSALWLLDGSELAVAAVTDARVPVVSYRSAAGWGSWTSIKTMALDPDDASPGVAITTLGGLPETGFFARNRQGLLINSGFFPLGGVLASPPAAIGVNRGGARQLALAALIDDHGHPGVWWRFNDVSYTPPCNYNRPGTCAQCGCGGPGQPRCDL